MRKPRSLQLANVFSSCGVWTISVIDQIVFEFLFVKRRISIWIPDSPIVDGSVEKPWLTMKGS